MSRIQELISKLLRDECSETEKLELFGLVEKSDDAELKVSLEHAWKSYDHPTHRVPEEVIQKILQKVKDEKAVPALAGQAGSREARVGKVRVMRIWQKIAVAACLIGVILAAGYFALRLRSGSEVGPSTSSGLVQDVQPGKDGAILTLADGRKIVLDDLQNGKVTEQAEKKGNELSYNTLRPFDKLRAQDEEYNTMSTPKGRQFTLVLADGSKVWLNAASSITYPTSFTGKERRVTITGEAYFEVAKNARQPFIVSVIRANDTMNVQALGTQFNINSYQDEETISTTLIEGSVRISNLVANTILKPGQQTQLLESGTLTLPKEVDTDEITSWKDGFFNFESADIKTILRQFARWYDIEVVYEGPVSNRKFFGIVKRSNTLKGVLEMLKDNKVIYQIEGKKLIVKSN